MQDQITLTPDNREAFIDVVRYAKLVFDEFLFSGPAPVPQVIISKRTFNGSLSKFPIFKNVFDNNELPPPIELPESEQVISVGFEIPSTVECALTFKYHLL